MLSQMVLYQILMEVFMYNLAIVGATGLVGRCVLKILEEKKNDFIFLTSLIGLVFIFINICKDCFVLYPFFMQIMGIYSNVWR